MKKTRMMSVSAAVCMLIAAGCGNNISRISPELKAEISGEKTSSEFLSESVSSSMSNTEEKPSEKVSSDDEKKPEPVIAALKSVEVYDAVTVADFIIESEAEIVNGDDLLDTSRTGEFEISVSYLQDGAIFWKKVRYIVEDTETPLILNTGWNPYHKTGTAFDLNDYVGFADNYDRCPVLTYEGGVDPDTAGDYPITATVTDSSGNQTSWDMCIYVVDELPNPPDTNERIDFGDFMSDYAGEGRRFGIDVSTWQGDIDFNAVKEAGCSFVMIRIGYYYDDIVMDDRFYDNIQGARDAELDIGVYFYTTDNSVETIREHARWITETLGGEPTDLPVAFDWEEFTNFQKYGMNIRDLNELYLAFSDEMSTFGYDTMLYSSKNFLNNFWSSDIKNSSPVWLAHYVDETDYEGDFYIWQQSNCGRISGIYGDVDMNVMYIG
ncbi:MAG: glycoside hydrolase family 25 [Ruminococcus flavefaciens]|nr:glycoside hydrolase family 25 [Ruminococcus flavefaciens]MCM1059019.1 glycoside hydrolase family 25 [Eubacterium sp.]